MIVLTLEQEKELRMTIKSVSFDLDDTFWPLMPTIMDAERNARTWIKENYEAALTSLDREDLNKNLIKEGSINELVLERSIKAFEAGADGVIASSLFSMVEKLMLKARS